MANVSPPPDCLIEFSVTPLGAGESVSAEVAECVRIVRDSGLPYELHAMGTIVEGPLEDLLALVARCMRRVAERNARVTCAVKLDLRPGHGGRIAGKVARVQAALDASGSTAPESSQRETPA